MGLDGKVRTLPDAKGNLFLGIDAGWKRLRIFGEVGFGQQGLAYSGIRYRW